MRCTLSRCCSFYRFTSKFLNCAVGVLQLLNEICINIRISRLLLQFKRRQCYIKAQYTITLLKFTWYRFRLLLSLLSVQNSNVFIQLINFNACVMLRVILHNILICIKVHNFKVCMRKTTLCCWLAKKTKTFIWLLSLLKRWVLTLVKIGTWLTLSNESLLILIFLRLSITNYLCP
jgi:hypothetical protein